MMRKRSNATSSLRVTCAANSKSGRDGRDVGIRGASRVGALAGLAGLASLVIAAPLSMIAGCSGSTSDIGSSPNATPTSTACSGPSCGTTTTPGTSQKDGGTTTTHPPGTSEGDGGGTTPTHSGSPPYHPFGNHDFTYAKGALVPTGAQATLDAAVASFYDSWKANYVKQGCGGYYVLSGGGTGTDVGDEVSEGHGYGMVVTAFMAGHDPNAQKVFDGMYAFFRKFPSSNQSQLMGWTVDVAGGCKFPTPDGKSDSATDGDLDVAFGLLLANAQWGSAGAIDYLGEAKKVIGGIKAGDTNPTTHLTNLGDWAEKTDYSTRPSDFMQDHFRAFARATGDNDWTKTVDAIYALTATVTGTYSKGTGLMPDFVVDTNSSPKPAQPNFLEGPDDGAFSWNSCRNPWRIATDFVITGDQRSRTAAQTMTAFMKSKTGGDPRKIFAGYDLDGTATSSDSNFAFMAPWGVAAMADPGSQAWLDAIWKDLVAGGANGYYGDSIKMQVLLTMAGDWWAP